MRCHLIFGFLTSCYAVLTVTNTTLLFHLILYNINIIYCKWKKILFFYLLKKVNNILTIQYWAFLVIYTYENSRMSFMFEMVIIFNHLTLYLYNSLSRYWYIFTKSFLNASSSYIISFDKYYSGDNGYRYIDGKIMKVSKK